MKDDWHKQCLADITVKITDGSHNPPKGVTESEFFMLSSKNVFDDDLHYANPRHLTAEQFQQEDKRTGIVPGDVLLTIVGTIGRSAVVPADAPRITLQRSVAVIRPNKQLIEPRFLMYSFIRSSDELNAQGRGVAQKGIYLETLRVLELLLPPPPEQQRIVALLDEAFAGLATAKANAERNLQNARAIFESHLQSVFSQLGEGWEETTLDRISTNLDSRRVPITKNIRSSGEYPYYGASGIVDYVADYIFEGDNLLVSEDGANLLARSTPIAFSVSGKYWVNNHAHILHFENMATQRFVEFYLKSIKLDDYITGAAQPKLNQKALNSIPIPIPSSVEVQAQIVDSVVTLQAETQRLSSLYERKLAALEELKKSLLHQAFNGEL